MVNALVKNLSVVELDGFSDFTHESEGGEDINTSNRVIVGGKFKFLDPRWLLDGEGVTGMRATLIGVRNIVNKWSHDNTPLVTRILAPGEKFPDFKRLNAECDHSEWRTSFGKEVGPWSGQHCLYFVDEHWNRYTWPSPTSTIGSAIAVREIIEDINLVRKFRDEHVYAVVELSHTDFRTSYGMRQRPKLVRKDLVKLGSDRTGSLPAPDTPGIPDAGAAPAAMQGAPADAQSVSPLTAKEVTGDEIPY